MRDVEVVLEEYKLLWAYYIQTLEERANLINYYFKSVTIPAGVIGLIALRGSRASDPGGGTGFNLSLILPQDIVAVVFGIVFIVGLCLYITYAKECSNASKYELAMKDARTFLKEKAPDLSPGITIDEYRSEEVSHLGSIKFWRAAFMVAINSALAIAALQTICRDMGAPLAVLGFVGVSALHVLVYNFMFVTYLKK